MDNGPKASPELYDFKRYIQESGVTETFVEKMLKLAQDFFKDAAGNSSLEQLNENEKYSNKEEIFCAIAWFLMYQAISQNKPLHKGMFLLDVGDPQLNKKIFEYFKFHENSRERPSSHFNRKFNKEEGSYGLTLEEPLILPGPFKKEHGLEKLTTGLFMLLDEKEGRIAFKYEDYPFDPIHYPVESYKHTANWVGGVKTSTDEVVGRREDALPTQVYSQMLHFINNTKKDQMTEFCDLQLMVVHNKIKQLQEKKPLSPEQVLQLKKLKSQQSYYERTREEKINLKEKLDKIDIKYGTPETIHKNQEEKAKAIFKAFGYIDDMQLWLQDLKDKHFFPKHLLEKVDQYIKSLGVSGAVFGSEIIVAVSGATDPKLTNPLDLSLKITPEAKETPKSKPAVLFRQGAIQGLSEVKPARLVRHDATLNVTADPKNEPPKPSGKKF